MSTSVAGARPSVLSLSHISKRFGDASALIDVSLDVRARTVHALLGENGAGKTTLMRIAFGLLAPDAGTLTITGAQRGVSSAGDAIAAGVGMVHQHFTNVPEMTVAENVALGGRGRYREDRARLRVMEIGARNGLVLDPAARAADLSVGGQQRLEIVKALARDARILILDEPTAVLAPGESEELLKWLRRFADEGSAVVLITHKLHEALSIADDVTVLRRGRVLLSSEAANVTLESLASTLLGEEASQDSVNDAPSNVGNPIVVTASNGSATSDGSRGVRWSDVEIRAGEVVGVAAIEGSGQRDLLRAFAGRIAAVGGYLRLPGSVGFVPEDRHRDAIVLPFSIEENVALRGAGERRGLMPTGEIREQTVRLISTFDIRGASATAPVQSLSGGNQQKLVLARELDGAPALLVVENPTRGLDLRATRAVHERLRSAAASGAAVVIYSSDIDEVLALATRILVVYNGDVREVSLDRDVVGRAMLGL